MNTTDTTAANPAEEPILTDNVTPNDTETLTNDDAVTVNGGLPDDEPNAVTGETATSAEGTTAPADQSATDAKDQEIADLKDKYLRLLADFENLRRRTAKEKLELIGTANEGLLLALLPVVDDFERALPQMDVATDVAAVKEGVTLIYQKLTRTLEGKGLKKMDAKGQPFDADVHESVTQFPAPSDDLKGKVIDELERGYTLNEKVIRHAKVVVGS